jgi:hypothetical protein
VNHVFNYRLLGRASVGFIGDVIRVAALRSQLAKGAVEEQVALARHELGALAITVGSMAVCR